MSEFVSRNADFIADQSMLNTTYTKRQLTQYGKLCEKAMFRRKENINHFIKIVFTLIY